MNVFKIVNTVDSFGYIKKSISVNINTGEIYGDELDNRETVVFDDVTGNFLHPKWDFENEMWVEGATKEELEVLKQEELEIKKQGEQEKLKQDLDKKLLQTISDLQMEVAMLKMKGGK